MREERFGRAVLHAPAPLKLEFVNDVPLYVGQPWVHPLLGRLDTKENILANKVSALLDRQAPKGLVDIYWLCCVDKLDLLKAIEDAQGKAAGLFPPAVAAALQEGLKLGLPRVSWCQPPDESLFRMGILSLINRIMGS